MNAFKDFYRNDVCCKDYADIEVPGHIQLQGYDRCQYINTMYPWDGVEARGRRIFQKQIIRQLPM